MYKVSYFCAVGTSTKKNQDRVLVNGDLIQDGLFHLSGITDLSCYVADGVGSMEYSENAAQFVLEALSQQNPQTPEAIAICLNKANLELVKLNSTSADYRYAATTLCGMLLHGSKCILTNVGDSEILLYRNGKLSRITIPQVLDEDVPNSPITSYLGSQQNRMLIDFHNPYGEYQTGDVLIITTDGLLKAIRGTDLGLILDLADSFENRISRLYEVLTEKEAPDNLGAIFITV